MHACVGEGAVLGGSGLNAGLHSLISLVNTFNPVIVAGMARERSSSPSENTVGRCLSKL